MKYRIKIEGGLGNQIFQWAQGVFIKSLGAKICYDISFYLSYNGSGVIPNRDFDLEKILIEPISKCSDCDSTLIQGYWQTDNNVDLIKNAILEKIKPCKTKTEKDSCSIHVRRGDYVKLKHIYHNLDKSYYIKCLETISPSGPIYIFSDDIDWCKKNLSITGAVYPEGNNALEDFDLMRSCNHNIISNSTFSWWAALLNPNEDKKIIQPSVWFKNESQGKLLNPNWQTI
tara:strand:+ start:273 stop:959 length:687 start_codon:yes stop_codon:yes gene_type:complete